MKRIDCSGLQSNKSIKKIKKYFDTIGEGDAIVFVDSELANDNVIKYANSQGYSTESTIKDNGFEIIIEKRGCLEVIEEKEFIVLITTDKLGEGNDKLGKNLMVSYFDALSEGETIPTKVIFLNGGVRLVCQNSDILDGMNLLKDKGVKIYVSEASLRSYGLEEKLAIGTVIDMGLIVEIMNNADEVIKL